MMNELVNFCHTLYGDDIPFDENDHTLTIHIPMGEASFRITTIANLK